MPVISRRLAWFAALLLVAPLLTTLGNSVTSAAAATTFVVDTAADLSSLDACTAAPGDCSLRGAISAANASPGADTIHFDIPIGECPDGVCQIAIESGGFTITEAVDLDATTQPRNGSPQANVCATATQPSYPRIEVVLNAGLPQDIFYLNHTVGSTRIRGFAIGTAVSSAGTAVYIPKGSGHHIACNHIGLGASGTGSPGGGGFAAGMLLPYDSNGVIIGTDGDGVDDIAERNVFGPGAVEALFVDGTINNVIAGNYFGLNAAGTMKLGGGELTLRGDTEGTRVGSDGDGVSDEAERNYFAGATNIKVTSGSYDPDGVVIAGNTFGLSPTGALTNSGVGIDVSGIPLSTTGFEIRDNTFGLVESAIDSFAEGGDVLITGNTFGIDHNGTPYGSIVAIRAGGTSSYEISNNLIRNTDLAGVVIEDTATLADSRDNCVVDNFFGLTHTGTVDEIVFESNWWGDPSGPAGSGTGSGDLVSTRVDFDPWLTSPAPPCNSAPVAADANFTVSEDAAVGTAVGTVSATDDGTDLVYAITAGNWNGAFAIDAAGGEITVAKPLDYETIPAYLLTVEVSDPHLSDTASVAVVLTDVDEPEPEPRFRDVPTTHTFFDDIEWLAATGITLGCNPPGNDLYCPDGSVTRGQMAAFLHRALGDVLVPGTPVEFVDDDGTVFETDIEWLGSVGVTRGCNPPTNDMFCPADVVTRGQMAAFLVRALELPAGSGIDFVDDDGSIFEDDIERLAAAGITRGCNPPINDMFCPNDPVKRDQMAAFLHRALTMDG